MYYITIKVALPVPAWSWNYTHFQFNIYYNSISCLYNLIPRGSVYTIGDRLKLFSPSGSVLPAFLVRGIDLYLVPRTALGWTESHVTPT